MHGLWEADKHKLRFIVSGALLMLAGVLVRFMTIYVFAAFLVIAFIYCAVSYVQKDKEKKGFIADLGKRFAVCVIMLILTVSMPYAAALQTWIRRLLKKSSRSMRS